MAEMKEYGNPNVRFLKLCERLGVLCRVVYAKHDWMEIRVRVGSPASACFFRFLSRPLARWGAVPVEDLEDWLVAMLK